MGQRTKWGAGMILQRFGGIATVKLKYKGKTIKDQLGGDAARWARASQ